MVTQIPSGLTANQALLQAITISSSPQLAEILPAIAIGDILRLTVRQNQPNGKGVIFFKGAQVPAQLPENAKPGDTMFAKVTQSGDQIILKILDGQTLTRPPDSTVTQRAEQLREQLTNFVDKTGAKQLYTPEAFALPAPPEELEELAKQIFGDKEGAKILALIKDSEDLVEPRAALQQLLKTTDGSLSTSLKEAAVKIRELVDRLSPPPEHKLLQTLSAVLEQVLEQSSDNNEMAARNLHQLVEDFSSETLELDLKTGKKTQRGPERAAIDRALNSLSLLSQQTDEPEKVQSKIKQILDILKQADLPASQKKGLLDSKTAGEMNLLASRFEQMSAMQDTLNKLNPVMHALGEPALIMFPFLFHGLMSHSEVTFEAFRGAEKKKDKKGGGGESGERYRRIQLTVPLPAMGSMHVDIAHRPKEILVRFTSPDAAIVDFMQDKLEHLTRTLRIQGFDKAELYAAVGKIKDSSPTWSNVLSAKREILA